MLGAQASRLPVSAIAKLKSMQRIHYLAFQVMQAGRLRSQG
jgi:hypothetical protein